MKFSRLAIHRKTFARPSLRFEDQQLTSFAGLVLIQQLFERLSLKDRLRRCFSHLAASPIFGHASIVQLLVVHMLLGYRELRHIRYYADDPLVRRVLGLSRLPDVATISRALSGADQAAADRLRVLAGSMVLERLAALGLKRLTLDFDGSVLSTGRFAEATAVGFNPKKKGARSYYPLFCTLAQTGQVFDVLHRPGNVHDSRGASAFMKSCISRLRAALPGVVIELRMDAAFFSDAILTALESQRVEYTVSVPFERLTDLKARIEARRRWRGLGEGRAYFELAWQAKAWSAGATRRLVIVRSHVRRQHKGPVQLDLFAPYEYGCEFKAIMTNKSLSVRKLLALHEGRGMQEALFAELKSDNQMDYIATRTWVGNQIYLLGAVLAHNLARELQMIAQPRPVRPTLEKRPALWEFTKLDTLRRRLLQRAGRLIRPQGRLTLSMSANPVVQAEMLHYMNALSAA